MTLFVSKFPLAAVLRGLAVSSAILLAGCVTVESEPEIAAAGQAAEDQAEPAPTASTARVSAGPKQPPEPHEYPVSPFTKESLYQLLVAEVAGYRGEYETALEKYLQMAIDTRDPGVAARATRLAAYLKDNDAALTSAQIWTEEDPDDIDAHRHAADQLMKAGDLEGAVHHLEAVKRLGGLANFPMFAYRAANLDADSRNALLRVIDRMLTEFPDDEQLLFSKAVLLEQNGQFSEALELSNQLLEDSGDINVTILKVNTLKNLHRLEEAVAFLEGRLEAMKDNRRLRLMYARLLFEAERLDAARKQYELVHQESPSDGDVLFALALIAMEQDRDQTARNYLEQMVRWNRRTGEAHFYLGSIAERNGEMDRAIREYKQAGSGYEFLPAQSRIADLMVEQGRISDARAWLETQRAENPGRHNQLIMVEAQLLSERGHKDALFDLMDQAVENDPRNIDLLYYRAMSGQKFDRLDILERDLRRIIEIDPDNADALNALGYTLTDQTDRHQEALQLIQRALEIKPNEAAFIDSLGWVMYRLGTTSKRSSICAMPSKCSRTMRWRRTLAKCSG
ncbi:MAG: tetratricopeptide repeat protein [Gammaproteobacteria bacterium]|nr:tetratricopeptide repeat protein [Gammaproteobacteria bacterium]